MEQDYSEPSTFLQRARAVLERTRSLIERHGAPPYNGRLAGTDACRRTAEDLCLDLQSACGSAAIEPFETRPGAFTGFYRIGVVLYLVGIALLLLNRPLAGGIVILLMFAAGYLQFGWYIELYDPLFRRQNVLQRDRRAGAAQPAHPAADLIRAP